MGHFWEEGVKPISDGGGWGFGLFSKPKLRHFWTATNMSLLATQQGLPRLSVSIISHTEMRRESGLGLVSGTSLSLESRLES